jgi:hypothetical protein
MLMMLASLGPPADSSRDLRAVWRCGTSIVVQDPADATAPGEQRIAAVAEQVEVERLVGLLLVVTLDLDGDRLRRLAGAKVSVPALAL